MWGLCEQGSCNLASIAYADIHIQIKFDLERAHAHPSTIGIVNINSHMQSLGQVDFAETTERKMKTETETQKKYLWYYRASLLTAWTDGLDSPKITYSPKDGLTHILFSSNQARCGRSLVISNSLYYVSIRSGLGK